LTESIAESVARNVREARTERGWTLDQLAGRSGVSKGMVVQIEQARTNPSIGTMSKLGQALGVSLSDLVDVQRGPVIRMVPAEDAARLWETESGSSARLLVGGRRPDFIELWEWVLMPGDRYEGNVHAQGMKELLHVIDGTLTLMVGDAMTEVGVGSSASYDGDQSHSYLNAESDRLRFILVMLDPSGSRAQA